MKKIALVLSSGGAKGYAHIGAIKAIEEKGYEITSIAGTSMGALIGGLYAAGKLDEAYRWFKGIDNWQMFELADVKNISPNGLINGEYIFAELRKIVGNVRIEDLRIPFCCVAADLDTGEEVVFTKGRLLDAIRASVSLPGFFKPYKIGNKRYIDGGVVNGLPINRVRRQRGDSVIAINLDTYGKESSSPVIQTLLSAILGGAMISVSPLLSLLTPLLSGENALTVILDALYISLKQNKLAMVEREHPEVYVNIDLKGYSTHNFSDAEAIVKLGYNQLRRELYSL